MMPPRLFRLMEIHQRIDGLLQLEKQGWRDPFRTRRLEELKLRIKSLMRRAMARPMRPAGQATA